MAKIYRVSLIEEDGDEYGTLFELAGSPGMVGATAPAAIVTALAEIGIDVAPAQQDIVRPVAGAVATAPLGTVFGGVTGPTKRTRRTKAEIAAAEQALQEADATSAVAAAVDEPTSAQVELAAAAEPAGAEQVAAPYDPFRQ